MNSTLQPQQRLEEIRNTIKQLGIDSTPAATADFFNEAFLQWFSSPEKERNSNPLAITLAAVALGDWIQNYTTLIWHFPPQGPPILFTKDLTKKVNIFNDVAQHWGSRERLDDYIFAVARSHRNDESDLTPLPTIIRTEPFDHIDEQIVSEHREAFAQTQLPETLDGIATAYELAKRGDVDFSPLSAQDVLAYAWGSYLISTHKLGQWHLAYFGDGSKEDVIQGNERFIRPLHIMGDLFNQDTDFAQHLGHATDSLSTI